MKRIFKLYYEGKLRDMQEDIRSHNVECPIPNDQQEAENLLETNRDLQNWVLLNCNDRIYDFRGEHGRGGIGWFQTQLARLGPFDTDARNFYTQQIADYEKLIKVLSKIRDIILAHQGYNVGGETK